MPKPPKAPAATDLSTSTSSGTGTGTSQSRAAGSGTAQSDAARSRTARHGAAGSGTTHTSTAHTSTTHTSAVSTAWTRAALPLCLLAILDTEKQSYGYALLNHLATAGIHGVKAATLYPALTRLEEDGSVEIEWGAGEGGPGRKYYRITDAGRARLHHDRTAWASFTHSVATLTGTSAPSVPGEVGAASSPSEASSPGSPSASRTPGDPGPARPTSHTAEPGEPT
ncbi:PadR family transcriptional regulator [Streptomyces flavofungini]|uniref:PadR family transcriptional regulator n=1 Tax=Streptomyces flavofungini TaxID=68200 RepID=UPI0025AEED79|nr:PadR family transcriptional regulator [Streptomyces flavofungini]WJV47907.1 PadR family transcriptional regulator [Streptomyces flavofungini]